MTSIEGVVVAPLQRFADERGAFVEFARFSGYGDEFRQANHSHSRKGVLRGLHFHRNQADLWYFVTGRAQVALADLRNPPEAVTSTLIMEADEPTALYVPPGVAHGFLALTDVDLIYLVTQEFDNSDEQGIAWNDPELAIPWMETSPTLSERDRSNEPLRWNQIPKFS